ncbi:MAG TPA: L,D-transpeptidase [Chthoniobacteraceae bacterium]|nr:L,D-transpeptidase [Chthoniobacteraceae bacterium]
MNRTPRLLLLLTATVCFALVGTAAPKGKPKAAPSGKASQQQIEEYTRLQIFLDNANFGPGKIDGHDGIFTRKALALYRKAQGQPDEAAPNAKAPPVTTGLDLQSIQPVFTEYEITKEDAATVGPLPSGPEAQSKVKALPYATLAEAIAEKFHCDLDFLKKLNPGKAEHLKARDKVQVPNVKPFELAEVKTLKPGSEAANVVANEIDEPADHAGAAPAPAPDTEKKATGKDQAGERTKAGGEAKSTPELSVHVSVAQSMLEVRDGDKVVAAFPVTVGSSETASPIGQWKVRAVAKFPNFRYDKKMLMKGERSSDFKMLPAGPNNPVGVMWIALNKKGIGLHGTNDPDSIGRSASHGCIRLANWDVVKLAGMVKPGVAVTIE